jgi:hypothetical protein
MFPEIFNYWHKFIQSVTRMLLLVVRKYSKYSSSKYEYMSLSIRFESWWVTRRGSVNHCSWIVNWFVRTISIIIAKKAHTVFLDLRFSTVGRWEAGVAGVLLVTYEVLSESSWTRSEKKYWLNLLNFGCHFLQNSLLGNVYSDPIIFPAFQKHYIP